jgi:hypothetical protein
MNGAAAVGSVLGQIPRGRALRVLCFAFAVARRSSPATRRYVAP